MIFNYLQPLLINTFIRPIHYPNGLHNANTVRILYKSGTFWGILLQSFILKISEKWFAKLETFTLDGLARLYVCSIFRWIMSVAISSSSSQSACLGLHQISRQNLTRPKAKGLVSPLTQYISMIEVLPR